MLLFPRLLAWLLPARPALAPASPVPEALNEDGDPFDPFPGLPRVSLLNRFVGGAEFERGDSIANGTTKLGTALDKVTDGRPDLVRRMLSTTEIDALVRANGYARRIVATIPSLGTRKGWSVRVQGETSDPLAQAWRDLHAWQRVAEVWRWARQHGGAVLWPILEEDVPGEFANKPQAWLREPLDLNRVRRVVSLHVFTRDELSVEEWDGSPKSDGYRGALRWSVTPLTPGRAEALPPSVHASRLIYWDGAPVPPAVRVANSGFGDSILESCFDQIRNKTAAEQGMAHLMTEARINVLKLAGLRGKQASEQRDAFEGRMRTIARSKSMTGVVLIAEDDEFQTQGQIVSGLGEVDERAGTALAAVSGTPQTVLFGDSPGGLNSDGESSRHTLAQSVSAAQEEEARERVEWLARLIFRSKEGPTKGVEPEGWELIFAPLDEPTRSEQAGIEKTHAETDAIRIASGVVSAEHVARSRFGPAGYSDELAPVEEDLEAGGFADQAAVESALKADADSYPVPRAVRANARRVLRWREEHADEVRGMTEVGWRRARQLAESPTIGLETIRKMASFARHARNAAIAPEFEGTPWKDAGYVAWLGWGGDEGIVWAKRVSEEARDDRQDAAVPVVVWFAAEATDESRLQAARSAVADLPGMMPSGASLHLTIRYMRLEAEALPVLVAAVQEAAAALGEDWRPPEIPGRGITSFDADASGRVPVVVEVGESWLYRLREDLDARLRAADVEAESGWWFRPHVTLGYASAQPDHDAHERLEHDPAGRAVAFRVRALEVRQGDAVLWSRGF